MSPNDPFRRRVEDATSDSATANATRNATTSVQIPAEFADLLDALSALPGDEQRELADHLLGLIEMPPEQRQAVLAWVGDHLADWD